MSVSMPDEWAHNWTFPCLWTWLRVSAEAAIGFSKRSLRQAAASAGKVAPSAVIYWSI
jgi:hypothetical protein